MNKKRLLTHDYAVELIDINNIELFNKGHIFYFNEEVDIETSGPICKQLLHYSLISKGDIKLHINCYGGEEEGGLAVIDTMQQIPNKIITIIRGTACSMAALISICGDKRYATKNSSWMMHDSYFEYQDDAISKIKKRLKFDEKITERLHKLLKEKTNLSDKEIRESVKGELWMFAEEMLAKGIIDKII